ncbi:MAG: protein jag [Dehalococcoidia bacterium]|nr:protein jag [Dehalococcoidia bacterium]
MENLEITAKTVEQAIEKAEGQLGIGRDQFDVVVVREGKTGILGVGSEEALIQVKPLTPKEKDVVEVATEVLDTLLRLMGVTGSVEVLSEEVPIALNIEGDDLSILIGRRGRTLASLEYIVKLIVAGKLKTWLPLSVDIAEYKKRRRESLQRLALHIAEQVKLRRHAITLEPMPPGERRILHLTLADNPDVTTHSIDEGENRKVVISLRQI